MSKTVRTLTKFSIFQMARRFQKNKYVFDSDSDASDCDTTVDTSAEASASVLESFTDPSVAPSAQTSGEYEKSTEYDNSTRHSGSHVSIDKHSILTSDESDENEEIDESPKRNQESRGKATAAEAFDTESEHEESDIHEKSVANTEPSMTDGSDSAEEENVDNESPIIDENVTDDDESSTEETSTEEHAGEVSSATNQTRASVADGLENSREKSSNSTRSSLPEDHFNKNYTSKKNQIVASPPEKFVPPLARSSILPVPVAPVKDTGLAQTIKDRFTTKLLPVPKELLVKNNCPPKAMKQDSGSVVVMDSSEDDDILINASYCEVRYQNFYLPLHPLITRLTTLTQL